MFNKLLERMADKYFVLTLTTIIITVITLFNLAFVIVTHQELTFWDGMAVGMNLVIIGVYSILVEHKDK